MGMVALRSSWFSYPVSSGGGPCEALCVREAGPAGAPKPLVDIAARGLRPPGDYIPSSMPAITQALLDGRVRVLCLFGTNLLSHFADASRAARGLDRVDLVVAHDLFLQETARTLPSSR